MNIINKQLIIKLLLILITTIGIYFLVTTSYVKFENSFKSNGNVLVSTLLLPKNVTTPVPVVIFVHGDGPSAYDNYGYYSPLWSHFAESGIASFSWNKAGINGSTGNWQQQSMDNRAQQVIDAIKYLKSDKRIDAKNIGLIGYSQGGWVLPLAAKKSKDVSFIVVVSGAINWIQQGEFDLYNTAKLHDMDNNTISELIDFSRKENQELMLNNSYEEYLLFWKSNVPLAYKNISSPMTADRFNFAKINQKTDSEQNLKYVTIPVLTIFGDSDQIVDIKESLKIYQKIFKKIKNKDYTYKIFPNATHGLLKVKYFPKKNIGIWGITKLNILGDDAFSDGYNEYITNWVIERIKK